MDQNRGLIFAGALNNFIATVKAIRGNVVSTMFLAGNRINGQGRTRTQRIVGATHTAPRTGFTILLNCHNDLLRYHPALMLVKCRRDYQLFLLNRTCWPGLFLAPGHCAQDLKGVRALVDLACRVITLAHAMFGLMIGYDRHRQQ